VLLEEEGAAALSMRRVADRIGIRAPSIYKHLPDKQALEDALISEGFAEWAELTEQAAQDADPLTALGRVYRTFARDHPHLYRLMTEHPLRRDRLTPGVEARGSAPCKARWGLSRPRPCPLGARARHGRPRAQRSLPTGRRPGCSLAARTRGIPSLAPGIRPADRRQ
jgi:AcrR family transcriptional regulator